MSGRRRRKSSLSAVYLVCACQVSPQVSVFTQCISINFLRWILFFYLFLNSSTEVYPKLLHPIPRSDKEMRFKFF